MNFPAICPNCNEQEITPSNCGMHVECHSCKIILEVDDVPLMEKNAETDVSF